MTESDVAKVVGQAFLRAMEDSHVAPLNGICFDAAGRCVNDPRMKRAFPDGDVRREKALEMCLLADVEAITSGLLIQEDWGIYQGNKFTKVPMVRNRTKPMPSKPRTLRDRIR